MFSISGALAQRGALPTLVTYEPTGTLWSVTIDMRGMQPSLCQHLLQLMRCESADTHTTFEQRDTTLTTQCCSATPECTITLNGRAVAAYRVTDGALHSLLSPYCALTVMELRMLGQFPHASVPYDRGLVQDKAHNAPLTDLHTHLTSQIRARALLEVGAEADAAYPVELLHLIGADVAHLATRRLPSTPFSPAASDGLACEQVGLWVDGVAVRDLLASPALTDELAASMEIGMDEVITFDALERRIYRMRNPLAKNPAVVAGMIARIAEDYAAQGIRYAELAVTGALNTDWLESAIAALRKAEVKTGVSLRLLAALPRSLPPMEALRQLDIVKRISQHPYIVGVDFLGYEANKTRNFGWALSNIARYASTQRQGIDRAVEGWTFPDDFILRVHAGENGKNPDNVAEVLEIAETYGVRVRVGHAAYGNDHIDRSRAERLAEAGLLMIEFNPDSNMAMNNIDSAEQLPLRDWAGIPFVIASDGAGVYQTDNQQLLAASIFAGLDAADLAAMRAGEEAHIARQAALFTAKSEAFVARYHDDAGFIHWLRNEIGTLQQHDALTRLAPKRPLLIAGASGSSWARIDMAMQRVIRRGIRALVTSLDPDKVYFAMGRIKQEGIGQALDDALRDRQKANPHAKPFDVVGMLSGHQNMPTLAEHINHIVPLSGELMSVPTHMTALLKQHGGCALYVGGSAFTRDFIACSKTLGIPFGVMADVAGASGEKAAVLPPEHIFHGEEGMLAHARAMLGDAVFFDGLKHH